MSATSELEETFFGQCRMYGVPEPFREYRFAATQLGRLWRADFAWMHIYPPVLVEIEGGTYSQGRHTRGEGYQEDAHKYNMAQLLGYRVLRFTGDDVTSGRAILLTRQALAGRFPLDAAAPYQSASIYTLEGDEHEERYSGSVAPGAGTHGPLAPGTRRPRRAGSPEPGADPGPGPRPRRARAPG